MSLDLNKIGQPSTPEPVAVTPINSRKRKADAIACDCFRKEETEVKVAASDFKACFKKTITEIQRRGETIRDPLRIRTAMQESAYAEKIIAKTSSIPPQTTVQKLKPFQGGRHPITKLDLDTYIPAFGMRRLYRIMLVREMDQVYRYTKILQKNLSVYPLSRNLTLRTVHLEAIDLCNCILPVLEKWKEEAVSGRQEVNEKIRIACIGFYKEFITKIDLLRASPIITISASLKERISKLALPGIIFSLPRFYSKEQLLQELRLISLYLSSDNLDALQKKIDEIRTIPGTYIPHQIIDTLSETMHEGSKPVQVKSRIERVAMYSSLKITKTLFSSEEMLLQTNLKQEAPPSEFAFKMGPENHDELLMGSLVMALGLTFSQCVIPKLPVKLLGVEFNNTLNPEGIVSRWVAGTIPFPKDQWAKYNKAKQILLLVTSYNRKLSDLEEEFGIRLKKVNETLSQISDTSQNEVFPLLLSAIQDVHDLIQLRKRISKIKTLLEQVPKQEQIQQDVQQSGAALCDPKRRDQESLMALGTMDALFCVSDAIEEQLLRSSIDGTVRTVDQAKFFKGVKFENQELFFRFRSFAVGHPYAEEPMPRKIVEAILNLDYDKIEQEWKELDLVKNVPKKKLADFKERLSIFKRYIEQQQKEGKPILLREAVETIYAEFLPFIKAVDLMFGEPFENISTKRVGDHFPIRSLDSILKEAETNFSVRYPEIFDISFLSEMREGLTKISIDIT